jgi:hypothetical protein
MSNVKGTRIVIVVFSGVTEDEGSQCVEAVKRVADVTTCVLDCEAGGTSVHMPHVFDPREAIRAHMNAMHKQCDEHAPESRVAPVNARGPVGVS